MNRQRLMKKGTNIEECTMGLNHKKMLPVPILGMTK